MSMTIRSSAFEQEGPIPSLHTCDGRNLSPPLSFDELPENTATLTLIVDDPDAPVGVWVHWVAWNLPPVNGLAQGLPPEPTLPNGARQGRNDFGDLGWGGPCPPQGEAHRYYFRLYALDAPLRLQPGASRSALEQHMAGHVLAQAQLIGRYVRR